MWLTKLPGNIAVGDEEVIRFLHFINGFNQIFNNSEDQVINDKYTEIRKYLKEKKDGDMDTRDILTIKGTDSPWRGTHCMYIQ